MRAAVVMNAPFEGPGTIADWAESRGHELTEIMAPTAVFPDATAVDLLVVMGGPMSATDVDAHPWLADEVAYLESAMASGGPRILGICLGAQLLALALGGVVRRAPVLEIGWYPVTLTPGAREHDVLSGWPDTFVAGHWHGDTFDAADQAPSVATSAACVNQAFVAHGGRVVGLQFHLEWDEPALAAIVETCGADTDAPGVWTAPGVEMLGDTGRFAETRPLMYGLLDRMVATV